MTAMMGAMMMTIKMVMVMATMMVMVAYLDNASSSSAFPPSSVREGFDSTGG